MKTKSLKAAKAKAPRVEIVLDQAERLVLEDIARALVMPHRDVVRAQVILMVADGVSLAEVSRKVGLARRIVRKWAERFVRKRFAGLADAPRSGRPPRFSPDRDDASGQAGVRAPRRRRALALDVDVR
jgi:transposase